MGKTVLYDVITLDMLDIKIDNKILGFYLDLAADNDDAKSFFICEMSITRSETSTTVKAILVTWILYIH